MEKGKSTLGRSLSAMFDLGDLIRSRSNSVRRSRRRRSGQEETDRDTAGRKTSAASAASAVSSASSTRTNSPSPEAAGFLLGSSSTPPSPLNKGGDPFRQRVSLPPAHAMSFSVPAGGTRMCRRRAVEKEGDCTAGESLNTPPIGAASKRRRATTAAVTTPVDGYKSEFFMQHAGPVGPLGMFLVVPAISVRQNAVRERRQL